MGFLGEGVADFDRLGSFGELFKEFVIDSRLNEDTTTSATALALIPAEQYFD